MSSLKAIITDEHGNYNAVDNTFNKMPYVAGGIDVFSMGDTPGPNARLTLLNKLGRGNVSQEVYFKGLHDYPSLGEKEAKEAKEYSISAVNDTKNIVKKMEDHPKANIEAIISGNTDQMYPKYITHFADVQSPRDILANSNLNYLEMPDVYFYKDGKRVEGGKNVDTAVLLLPFILPQDFYNMVQTIFGDEISEKDFIAEAMKLLTEESGILDKIREANPKNIIQLQHELPKKEIFEPFGRPSDPRNKEIYETVMDYISEYVAGTNKEYTILFGHMEKGGTFKQTVNHKGKKIKTIHLKEGGKEVIYFDTKSGKIYMPGETPKLSEDEELSEKTIDDIAEEAEGEMVESEAQTADAE